MSSSDVVSAILLCPLDRAAKGAIGQAFLHPLPPCFSRDLAADPGYQAGGNTQSTGDFLMILGPGDCGYIKGVIQPISCLSGNGFPCL